MSLYVHCIRITRGRRTMKKSWYTLWFLNTFELVSKCWTISVVEVLLQGLFLLSSRRDAHQIRAMALTCDHPTERALFSLDDIPKTTSSSILVITPSTCDGQCQTGTTSVLVHSYYNIVGSSLHVNFSLVVFRYHAYNWSYIASNFIRLSAIVVRFYSALMY